MEALEQIIGLGKEARELGLGEMALRAAIVYIVTLAIVRMGKKRFMGSGTAFDMIVGIMLGSMASRALTGNAPLIPTMAGAAVLVAMHWLFSAIALRSHPFGVLIKGHPRLLVKDGKVDEAMMRKTHVTGRDLDEDLRGEGVSDVSQVAEGRLERSGQLSVIKAKAEPKIVDVQVAQGVQTVRIELA
ncbi:MAG: DUF421 domain-containing protein [Pseudomonadota bacterium]|nr:DUF421 domain-containing protein [Pseudomonadota bacterium]